MNLKKSHLVMTSFFLVLLAMMTYPSGISSRAPPLLVTRGVPVPGSDSFSDTFAATAYRDGPNTTAVGWGGGTIHNPRQSALVLLDSYSLPDKVYSVELQGRKLYTVLYDPSSATDTLRVFNVSDPGDIQQLGTRGVSAALITGEIDGDLMVLGDYDDWMAIYNVSDPTNIPMWSDSFTFTDGHVTDVEVQGRFVYVAIYQRAAGTDFNIFDITDPTNGIGTDGEGYSTLLGLDVQGDIAYLADGTSGLYLRNVSNPYNIAGLDSVNTPGNATDVVVDGDIAYVADGTSGVQVVDCSNPNDISIIDSYNTPGNALDVELQGDTLCVADGNGGVRILDVSDPSDIRDVTGFNPGYVRDIDIQDGILAVAVDNIIRTYSLGSESNPTLWSTYSTYDAIDVVVQGDIAYVAAGADGLVVLDVSDPANPTLLDRAWFGSNIDYNSIDVQGRFAYINNRGTSKAVHCFDVSDPTNVFFTDSLGWSYPYDVAVSGDVVYLADGQLGLWTMNVSNPYNIVSIAGIDLVENSSGVAVQGHFAYTVGNGSTSGDYGQHNFYIDDFSSPVFTDSISWVDARDIEVCGDYAAIANGDFGLNLGDITDPWNINNADGLQFTGDYICTAVAIFGNTIFAGERGRGIHRVDASNVDDLQLVSTYLSGSPDVRSLTVDGDFLYAACGDRLLIFRIFNSRADTWDTTTRFAQSIEVDTTDLTIENATLTYAIGVDFGTTGATVAFQLSADGGANWESVIGATPHTFVNQGHKLLWRATLSSNYNDRTPYIAWINIDYEYNDLPSAPTLTDPGTTDNDGTFTVSWSASTDASGSVASYQLQIDTSNTFAAPTSYVVTTLNRDFTGLTNDTYYFRVRALDDDSEYGPWSSTESIEVAIPPTTTTPPPPPNLIPLIIGIVVVIVVVLVLLLLYFLYFKKKK